MNIAVLPEFYPPSGAAIPRFVDEPLPVRAQIFTLRERIPRGGSFHPHRGQLPQRTCWTSHSDSQCWTFSPFSAAIPRTPAGLPRRIRKNTWPSSFIWFSGTTPARDRAHQILVILSLLD